MCKSCSSAHSPASVYSCYSREVGAGSGVLSVIAAKAGAEMVAIEAAPNAAALCRRVFEANGVDVRGEQT